jgi:hypothetical protein
MSPAFVKGTPGSLPNAAVTFDRFHTVKIVNDAVDQVRRSVGKAHALLKGIRFDSKVANGLVESETSRPMVYLLTGKLGLRLPA